MFVIVGRVELDVVSSGVDLRFLLLGRVGVGWIGFG